MRVTAPLPAVRCREGESSRLLFGGVSGGWLAANVTGYQGSDWDTYLLFGPDATWTSQPAPLRSSGSPVDHQIDDLHQALKPLLATP